MFGEALAPSRGGRWRQPRPLLSERETEACNPELSTPVQGDGVMWEGQTREWGPEKLRRGAPACSRKDWSETCSREGVDVSSFAAYGGYHHVAHTPLQGLSACSPSSGECGQWTAQGEPLFLVSVLG